MTRKLWWVGGALVLVLAAVVAGRATVGPSSAPAVEAREPAARKSRAAAAPAPQLSRTRVAASSLRRDIQDPDPVVRARAVYSGGADDPALLVALRDSDLNVSSVASEVLVQRYRDGSFSTREIATLYHDSSLGLKPRIALLNGLAERDDPEVLQLLLRALTDGTVEERRATANLIARQDPASAVPALIAALSDKDNWVRSHARDSLRELSGGRDLGEDAAAWSRWWSERAR